MKFYLTVRFYFNVKTSILLFFLFEPLVSFGLDTVVQRWIYILCSLTEICFGTNICRLVHPGVISNLLLLLDNCSNIDMQVKRKILNFSCANSTIRANFGFFCTWCFLQCWTQGRSSAAIAEDLRPTATMAEVSDHSYGRRFNWYFSYFFFKWRLRCVFHYTSAM